MWFYLITTSIIGALLYKLFFSGNKNFWEKHGTRQISTWGSVSLLDLLLGRVSFANADNFAIGKMLPEEKVIGIIDMGKPLLLVKDLEIVKRILIKDFDHFTDRRDFFTEAETTFSKQLPSLKGDAWKGVRSSVSPTFTTGKIRRMMECFNTVGKEWVEEFTKSCKANGGSANVGVVQAVNRYTVDVIANAAFGMNAGTITNPDNEFAKNATKVTDLTLLQRVRFIFLMGFPKLRTMLGISLFDITAVHFFQAILEKGMESRMSGQTKRNDFLQLLIEAKRGELKQAEEELEAFEKDAQLSEQYQNKKQYLTEEIMIGQCLIFFFAGFSTTSAFISFMVYAMALYPDIQQRLRQEVGKIAKPDGSLDYDDVNNLVYLDMVCCEVLRKFPAVGRLERKCVRDYSIPELGVTVPKEAMVGVPLDYIHNSREHYDNPEKFNPEHFSPEKKASRNPYAFMPFGIGPRNCIGMRFALTESKSAIAHMVHNFKIEPTANTPSPMKGTPSGFGDLPPKGLEVKLTPISSH